MSDPPPKRGPFVTLTSKIKITGIKNLIGSIVKIGSIHIGPKMLPALMTVAVLGTGAGIVGIGESANAWDVFDSEPDTVLLIEGVEQPNVFDRLESDHAEILSEVAILELDLLTLEGLLLTVMAKLDFIQADLDAIANFPPGPPASIQKDIDDIAEDTDAIFCAVHPDVGRCQDLPESVTE